MNRLHVVAYQYYNSIVARDMIHLVVTSFCLLRYMDGLFANAGGGHARLSLFPTSVVIHFSFFLLFFLLAYRGHDLVITKLHVYNGFRMHWFMKTRSL
ncbi:hypothetical protein ACJX0J_029758, partial [Zea mays]